MYTSASTSSFGAYCIKLICVEENAHTASSTSSLDAYSIKSICVSVSSTLQGKIELWGENQSSRTTSPPPSIWRMNLQSMKVGGKKKREKEKAFPGSVLNKISLPHSSSPVSARWPTRSDLGRKRWEGERKGKIKKKESMTRLVRRREAKGGRRGGREGGGG